MNTLSEMSIDRLYDSTIRAFPNTQKRQHATDPLKISSIHWTPFEKLKTLYVSCVVESEKNVYDTVLLFKDVNYQVNPHSSKVVPLLASDGNLHQFGKISRENTDVLVRCNCADFRWRWNHVNHLHGNLWGRKAPAYENKGGPPANPKQLSGMCKHLIKSIYALSEAGVFD
jgi:hypothetical protein